MAGMKTDRRALLSAAAALSIAGLAPAAAAAVARSTSAGPDAELIRICGAVVACRAACDAADRVYATARPGAPGYDAAQRRVRDLDQRLAALAASTLPIPAHTPAGVQSRALALSASLPAIYDADDGAYLISVNQLALVHLLLAEVGSLRLAGGAV